MARSERRTPRPSVGATLTSALVLALLVLGVVAQAPGSPAARVERDAEWSAHTEKLARAPAEAEQRSDQPARRRAHAHANGGASSLRRRTVGATTGRIGRAGAGARVFGSAPAAVDDAESGSALRLHYVRDPASGAHVPAGPQLQKRVHVVDGAGQQQQQQQQAGQQDHKHAGQRVKSFASKLHHPAQAQAQAQAQQQAQRQAQKPAQAAPGAGASDGASAYIPNLTRDKWIGLGLAISSSLAIGTSFIITKKGLIDAADRGSGLASDHHSYLQNPIWWAGMATMIVGEVANFAAYTFAPPILVTPLGALSVLIGAVLASFILKEELGRLGRVGCTLCLVGTLIIILNAPEDKEIQTVDEILNYAIQPAFLFYGLSVMFFAFYMIYKVVPRYGKRTPLVYISICSAVGSISVMSVKGFGVALKLTLDGNNQFTHPSTYCFALVTVVCILVQMNYFNKALDQFSTNVVNPIYYVMFTTSTIFASFLLFQGFNTEGAAPAVSLLCGFVVIFLGVYLLNLNRLIDPVTQQPRMSLMTGEGVPAGRASESYRERLLHGDNGMFHPRLSMSQQRHQGGNTYGQLPLHGSRSNPSLDRGSRRGSTFVNGNGGAHGGAYDGHGRRTSSNSSSVLFNAYDEDDADAMGLTRLDEGASDEEYGDGRREAHGNAHGNGHAQGHSSGRASGEGRAKAHARSISLKLPDGLHENRIRHSPVLATASSAGPSPALQQSRAANQEGAGKLASTSNLLGDD